VLLQNVITLTLIATHIFPGERLKKDAQNIGR